MIKIIDNYQVLLFQIENIGFIDKTPENYMYSPNQTFFNVKVKYLSDEGYLRLFVNSLRIHSENGKYYFAYAISKDKKVQIYSLSQKTRLTVDLKDLEVRI